MTVLNIRPVTGREYKLMLMTDKFKEREKGINDFLVEQKTKLI